MAKKGMSGTKEWASHNFNDQTGCRHGCLYCYARNNAVVRFKTRKSYEDWLREELASGAPKKSRKKYPGRVMFPTQHDITPTFLDVHIQMLRNLLEAGNDVLLVSKPHLVCIEEICEMAQPWRDKLMFRFTIGAISQDILDYWEPHAPSFKEREMCLVTAFNSGFVTSVSAEPLLEAKAVHELVRRLSPGIRDAIWIGKMNQVRSRVDIKTDEDERMVKMIEEGQTDEKIKEIYERHKENPKVKWKESIKKVVGVPLSTTPGEDV